MSLLDWLFKSGLSALAKKTWGTIRPDDLDSRLRAAVVSWSAGLPAAYALQPEAMFAPVQEPRIPEQSSQCIRELRGKLLRLEVPTIEDWFDALGEHWEERRRMLGGNAQPFFLAEPDVAEVHLQELARLLHGVCARDTELFRTTAIRLLPLNSGIVAADGLKLAALEVHDPEQGQYHATLDFKVFNDSNNVCFITSVELRIAKLVLLEHAMPRFSLAQISGSYDLIVDPKQIPDTARLAVSQVVYPQDADRFTVNVSIDPDCTLVFREAVLLVGGRFEFNGGKHLEVPERLISVPWPRRIRGQRGTYETAKAAAITNVARLESLLAETRAPMTNRLKALFDESQKLKEKYKD